MRVRNSDDPFAVFTQPPPNETPAEEEERVKTEMEAKRVSDEIDRMLQAEKATERRTKPKKILLLGQSESGKSTTLKNFQLMYTPRAFKAERASWRLVIYLNLVKSIRIVLEALTAANDGSAQLDSEARIPIPSQTPEQRARNMKLSPLTQVEEQLMRKLAGPGEVDAIRRALALDSWDPRQLPSKELSLTSTWKDAFTRFLGYVQGSDEDEGIDFDAVDDPGRVLHLLRNEMMDLWKDQSVQQILRAQRIRLEDQPGFFLNDLERLTEKRYVPSDDDVLRARLKTMGVTEYTFTMESPNAVGSYWKIYDVGGARSQRLFWAPFFDQVDAIIFLAPISCFDQTLAEDRSVNRLEDSVMLWRDVCSNRLLASVQMVLFLNKIDLFRAKLESGVQLSKFVTTYAPRANTVEVASAYLRRKFGSIQKEISPQPRQFFCHLTAVIDTQATSIILTQVGDMVVRANLKDSSLI